MLKHVLFVARHPSLRVYSLAMFIASTAAAATMPYRALAAIEVLGMSDQAFAAMVFASTVVSLVFGVSIGIISDFVPNRKGLMMLIALTGAFGMALVWGVPAIWSMAVTTVVVLPFANLNPLIYAGTREVTVAMSSGQAASVNSVVRTSMSAAWVFAPVLTAMFLERAGRSVISAWGISALLFAVCLVAIAFCLPPQKAPALHQGGKAGFLMALKELARPHILWRSAAVALLSAPTWLNNYTQALVIKSSLGGTLPDAGLMASGVALLEIPFMLMWAGFLPQMGTRNVLAVCGVLYAVYLGLLGSVETVTAALMLIPLAGLAAAGLLSVPLSYFQDMFPTRPGLGTALYPINSFASTGLAAGIFAVGNHYTDYQGTVLAGAVITLFAVVFFVVVDRMVSATLTRSGDR